MADAEADLEHIIPNPSLSLSVFFFSPPTLNKWLGESVIYRGIIQAQTREKKVANIILRIQPALNLHCGDCNCQWLIILISSPASRNHASAVRRECARDVTPPLSYCVPYVLWRLSLRGDNWMSGSFGKVGALPLPPSSRRCSQHMARRQSVEGATGLVFAFYFKMTVMTENLHSSWQDMNPPKRKSHLEWSLKNRCFTYLQLLMEALWTLFHAHKQSWV